MKNTPKQSKEDLTVGHSHLDVVPQTPLFVDYGKNPVLELTDEEIRKRLKEAFSKKPKYSDAIRPENRFDCHGSHCSATIWVEDVKDALFTQIICPKCGRKYILSFNEEYPDKEGNMRGYYLEPAEKY